MRPAFHALCALFAGTAALAAPLELQLVGVKGEPVPGTVVTLRSTDPSRAAAMPVQATMDQVDLRFEPHVLVVPPGSKVSFPNSDSVPHQVYSFSDARKFQLPLYNGKAHPPVEFPQQGVVSLGCNVHDRMLAYVYVVEAQHYGRTDNDGRWRVADIQPGEYELVIWHPASRATSPILERKITVNAAESKLTLRLAAPLKLRPASQIPANWDAY